MHFFFKIKKSINRNPSHSCLLTCDFVSREPSQSLLMMCYEGVGDADVNKLAPMDDDIYCPNCSQFLCLPL